MRSPFDLELQAEHAVGGGWAGSELSSISSPLAKRASLISVSAGAKGPASVRSFHSLAEAPNSAPEERAWCPRRVFGVGGAGGLAGFQPVPVPTTGPAVSW